MICARKPRARHRDGWEQFRAIDLKKMATIMATPVVVDLRKHLLAEEVMQNASVMWHRTAKAAAYNHIFPWRPAATRRRTQWPRVWAIAATGST